MTVERFSIMDDEFDAFDYENTDDMDELSGCIACGTDLGYDEPPCFDEDGDGPYCFDCLTDAQYDKYMKEHQEEFEEDSDWPY